jgi:hypothetical protein
VKAMKRSLWKAVAFTAMLLYVAGVAQAQDVEPAATKGISVKAGAFFPTHGSLKNQASSVFWAAGADYHPRFRHRLLNGEVVFGAEIAWRDYGGKMVFVLPLTAKLLWTITPPDARIRFYGGLGGGIYFINTPFLGGTTQPGVKFVAGADITPHIFLELHYDYVSGFSDNLGSSVRVDGLTTYLGYRF